MMRLATPGFLRFAQTSTLEMTFGGGEANVAVSLVNYGLSADFVTRLPQNDMGQAALNELRGIGVGTGHIVRGGDSFGAGLIFASLRGDAPQQAVEFAVAASALKHTIPGDYNRATLEEVEALVKGDGSGRVQR